MQVNTLYRVRSRVVEVLLHLENKQQIMPNNAVTQHKHMYSSYIGSLCNIVSPKYVTLYLHHGFPCIRKYMIAIKHIIRLYIGPERREIYKLIFSFNLHFDLANFQL